MDASPVGYAYRCLPLNIANAHGWEILNPSAFEATWDGGVDKSAIEIGAGGAISHFGCGVLTFHVMALFRTEPGWDLFVTGPVNAPKHGISPLTGVVETDWATATFTMNWKFTAPGTIRFEAGEPFCFFFPIERGRIEQVEPEIHSLASDPALAETYTAWVQSRIAFNTDLRDPNSQAHKDKWQKDYYLGKSERGHRTKLRLPSFKH
jgi:hypothetical protein